MAQLDQGHSEVLLLLLAHLCISSRGSGCCCVEESNTQVQHRLVGWIQAVPRAERVMLLNMAAEIETL